MLPACTSKKGAGLSQLKPIHTEKIKDLPSSDQLARVNVGQHLDEFRTPASDTALLRRFYTQRDNRLAWFEKGRLSRNVEQLLETLGTAWTEGLNVERYQVNLIYDDIEKLEGLSDGDVLYPALYAHLDILLTRAWFEYANDMLVGSVNPVALGITWQTVPRHEDLVPVLEHALAHHNIDKSLEDLEPQTPQYRKLRTMLSQLHAIRDEGGWPEPGFGPAVAQGDSSAYVSGIKYFLAATGDLHEDDTAYLQSVKFDQALDAAVRRFQSRHGLTVDGIAGKDTQEEMNHTPEYRIEQVEVNLERLRWLPAIKAQRYIVVNLPEFELRLYENNQLAQQMKVVVGKAGKSTPVLLDTIKYIVFNPTWRVPFSIASEEMLPKIKTDSTFLLRNHYKLLRGSYASYDTIDPASVDWSEITEKNFPFHIVQMPGRTNALGRVKFLFPNNHSIYLHDTPAQYLFKKDTRDFSHGCVRLDEPMKLAAQLLRGQMSEDSIRKIVAGKKTTTVPLKKRPVIWFVYQTAWMGDDGAMNFRKDIYNLDPLTYRLMKNYHPPATKGGSLTREG